MGSTLKVDNIVGTSGTSAPITLSGDTATLGSGVAGNWGLKLLQTETVSSAVSYKDIGSSSLFSSTYDTYKIIFTELGLASDNSI